MWRRFLHRSNAGSGFSSSHVASFTFTQWNIPSKRGSMPSSPYKDERSPLDRLDALERGLRAVSDRQDKQGRRLDKLTEHLIDRNKMPPLSDAMCPKPIEFPPSMYERQRSCKHVNEYRVGHLWRCADCGWERALGT